MFGASSELASVMEFGFNFVDVQNAVAALTKPRHLSHSVLSFGAFRSRLRQSHNDR